jgi:chemotaxis protein methyltransferase CheR
VLAQAHAGCYSADALEHVPPEARRRHFEPVPGVEGAWRVVDATRALVRFARLNLMSDWPMRGPFHLIVCRNVMIYFDKATQQRVVQRFTPLLTPGGHLFVGHTESLNAIDHELRYVRPAVYAR